MNDSKITNLRALDYLVGTEVMLLESRTIGFVCATKELSHENHADFDRFPRYSSDFAAMGQVLNRIEQYGAIVHIINDRYGGLLNGSDGAEWIAYEGLNVKGVADRSWGDEHDNSTVGDIPGVYFGHTIPEAVAKLAVEYVRLNRRSIR